MHSSILTYLKSQKVLALSTVKDAIPYSAICFYVYDETSQTIIFLSSTNTRHIAEIIENPIVAGAIFSQDVNIARLQGVQFTGKILSLNEEEIKKYESKYMKQNPLAKLIPHECWVIELAYIKMTNNTLGFGKKLIWERGQS